MNFYNQKQVIYLVDSPFSEHNFNRFGINNWIKHGWKVNVFDFTLFLHPKFWKFVNGDKLSFNFTGLKIFQNINEGLIAIESLEKKIVFIDLLGFSSLEMRIRKAVRRKGILVRILLGSLPEPSNKKNFFEIFSSIKKLIFNLKKLVFFITEKFKKIRSERNSPDYLVVSGNNSMLGIDKKKTTVIKAHNFDYDFFIKKKHIKLNKKRKILVFLDADGPYHSDYVFDGVKPFVTADKYFPVIDHGLAEIAKSLNLEIKIAAHPRSNYKVKQKKYKHSIIQNKTFELIRNADVVVAHGSTALQWAIIMKKPIIFVTTDEIQNEPYARTYAKYIDNFAASLGKKVVNFSDLSFIKNLRDYLNVDEEKYERYCETYVKTKGSPEKLIWDIVIEKLEKDLQLEN